MQQAIVRGDMIENDELIRLSSEVRRLLNSLRHRRERQQESRTPLPWSPARARYGMCEEPTE